MKKKHHGSDVGLVFDSGLGVYVVVDMPDIFFWDGVYLRFDDGRWYGSKSLDGGWKPRKGSAVPPRLASKMAKAKGKEKKHRGPAKRGW